MAHPETAQADRFKYHVERTQGHGGFAHGREADDRAPRRENRCEQACRRAAHAIERQVKVIVADRSSDPFRDISRIDDDDVTADRLELIDQLRRLTRLTVLRPRALAKAMTHRPTPELAAFCTTQSPDFRSTNR